MIGGFDQLERELVDAERRLNAARKPARSRVRRLRPRADLLAPALAVIATIAVAGGALLFAGRSGTHVAVSPATPPARPLSNRSPAGILGVLRRPQTRADRSSPLLRSRDAVGLRLIKSGARRATTTPAGKGVYVIPARPGSAFNQGAPARSATVVLAVGGAEAPFTVADVESGRAAFTDTQPAQQLSQAFVLVPDGVARVVLTATTAPTPIRLSSSVQGNVAVLSASGQNIAISPRQMRWYSTTGARIAIHDHPNPVARYPVNASGQTYGSAGEAASLGDEPDLISATGRGLHGGRITGYVRRTQLNAAGCANVKTPQQAIACTKRSSTKTQSIPIYAKDGKTIVGTFTIG